MIRALRDLRGIKCPYCGHNTRVFSRHCGLCHETKPFLAQLPALLLYLAVPLLVLLVVLILPLL